MPEIFFDEVDTVSFVERAALYDISRFARQFLHEQNVQDFHVTERADAIELALKSGAVGNCARTVATFVVEAGPGYLKMIVEERFNDSSAVATGASDDPQVEKTTLHIEGETIVGLLSWLRLSIAGWLDAARSR